MGSLFSLTKDHVVSLLEAYEIPAPPFTPAGQGNIYAKTTLVDALNALMHHIGVRLLVLLFCYPEHRSQITG